MRLLNYLLAQEAASEDAGHTHMLIRRVFVKAAKEGIPAFGLPCWMLQHASRCDSSLHEKRHGRLLDEEAEIWQRRKDELEKMTSAEREEALRPLVGPRINIT